MARVPKFSSGLCPAVEQAVLPQCGCDRGQRSLRSYAGLATGSGGANPGNPLGSGLRDEQLHPHPKVRL